MKKLLRKILPESFILWTHKLRGQLAARYYGFPAKKMVVIGVTGTNGKTTTVNLIAKILEEAGFKVGLASTINFKIGDKEWINKTKMTTLSPFILQKMLSKMVKAGCEYSVVETTSHAEVQYRVWGISYDVAVLTNITPEHIEYHGNFENYQNAKLKLFESLEDSYHKPGVKKISILPQADPSYPMFKKAPADIYFSYRIGGQPHEKSEIVARRLYLDASGSSFEVATPYGEIQIKLSLPGRFNVMNALAALSIGVSQNISLNLIKKALEKVTNVPGRMEKVDEGQDFSVIVDFAHTPDALQKIFETLKPIAKGKIISVLGATGERDKVKRPILGAIAGKYADLIYVTDEDPYHEDPQKIIDAVAEGVPRGRREKMVEGLNYFKILDRAEAIERAIRKAKKDDIVIITGKGGEHSMAVGDKKIPWDDSEIARKVLKKSRLR
jgi:UDP-N-acetylmuramoyl-L-alanyl-D-glutamate--2,6-diaminopimelate ligase